jgi:hypothetical protein
MFVLTIDQQDSRMSSDAVPQILEALKPISTVVPFARTIGDEVQGALDDPAAVAEAVRRIAVEDGWHIGIGIGDVEEPLPASTTEARGQAFYDARQAVESAKSSPGHLVVRAEEDSGHLHFAEASLRLLVTALGELREHSRGYVSFRLDNPYATQAEIASRFDVSQQAVSRVLAPGTAEIIAGAQDLAEHHLSHAEGVGHVD